MQNYNQKILNTIVEYMEKNSKITERELTKICKCSERTIRYYVHYLKSINKIKLYRNGKNREWIVYRD